MSVSFFNVLATFQSYINKICVKKLDILIIVCLENLSIYTKNSRQANVDAIW